MHQFILSLESFNLEHPHSPPTLFIMVILCQEDRLWFSLYIYVLRRHSWVPVPMSALGR